MTLFSDHLKTHEPLLRQLGVDPAMEASLLEFLEILWEQNKELNLVSRKMTVPELIDEHLMDSLIGLPHLPHAKVIADLGTGGGFPAAPLAICRPETRFLLFEKSPLKCKYLRKLAQVVPNLKVVGPLAPKSLNGGVDLVISRAFKPIHVTLDMTETFRKDGGKYCLFKARRNKIMEELKLAKLKEEDVKILALNPVGQAEERHLVFL